MTNACLWHSHSNTHIHMPANQANNRLVMSQHFILVCLTPYDWVCVEINTCTICTLIDFDSPPHTLAYKAKHRERATKSMHKLAFNCLACLLLPHTLLCLMCSSCCRVFCIQFVQEYVQCYRLWALIWTTTKFQFLLVNATIYVDLVYIPWLSVYAYFAHIN